MTRITIDAPDEEIDVSITLNDHVDYIDIEIEDHQLRELVDEEPEMVLDHIWEDHPEVVREFVQSMDAGERLALFTSGEKKVKKTSEDGITVYVNGNGAAKP